jgi:hypothetical protein
MLGLVPAASRVGDCVVAFAGGATPFVVRYVNVHGQEGAGGDGAGARESADGIDAHLIGDAYVHGLMDGEAVKRGPSREIRLH